MKILTVDKIREADAYTIKNEPVESINLMERAGTNCYQWISEKLAADQKVVVIAGIGNNGGDGLVIARLLAEDEYEVDVWVLNFSDKYSEDFQTNFERLKQQGKANIRTIEDKSMLPELYESDLVIDAIFGSGLGRPVKGLPADAIRHVNASTAIVVAVDIPSGMFADHYTDEKKGAVVHADYTLSLQLPKLGMMLSSNEMFLGDVVVIPIGLHPDFLDKVESNYHLIESEAREFIKPRRKFGHKGDYGHSLLIAGSYGKMGACVLAANACLRSGAGLVTAHIPNKGYEILQTAVPECMLSIDSHSNFSVDLPDIDRFDVVAAGPGIGREKQTQDMLKLLIQQAYQPLLLDADALNILAENPTWLSFLPANSILTPHPGEFDRLAGKSNNPFERLEKARDFAQKYSVLLVLKGAYTTVCTPGGRAWFNSTGNPGMATAGSGDTLTGIIAALMGSGYKPFEASVIGVYIHGLAGDLAADEKGQISLIASDITNYLSDAYLFIYDDFPDEYLPNEDVDV